MHDSDTSWLEIELLREGTRTVNVPGLAPSDYLAYADRTIGGRPGESTERQQLVWPIALRQRLPVLAVPLRPGERDVTLDLQAVLNGAYDRAAYDLEFDYDRPPASHLDAEDAAWAEGLLQSRKRAD